MPDREKYIEVLSNTAKAVEKFNENTPIRISLECIEDILELLKEQEAVEPKKESDGNPGKLASWWYVCGNCGDVIDWHDIYCRHCGREVKWNA